MYVHCSIRPFCFAAARLRPASAIPRCKSASSRGGGRGRGGGVERVEQSVAMDSSGMRKRVGLILERCGADLEKLIRDDSENGQSCRDASQACSAVRWCRASLKASLKWAPILGQYAMLIGCVPVERGKRAEAIKYMMEQVQSGSAPAGQLIIYPQGTRVAPNDHVSYKVGTAVLYRETGQKCVPAATNVGVFWPRSGIYREKGTAVVEFLDPIEQGLDKEAFMSCLERTIETKIIQSDSRRGRVRTAHRTGRVAGN